MTIPDLPSDGANPWGRALRSWGSAMKAALSGKADASHTHTIGHVNQLASELSSKALAEHLHSISDVNGLQAALDARAALPNPSGNDNKWLGISSNKWAIKDLPDDPRAVSVTLKGGVTGALRYIKDGNIIILFGYISNVPANSDLVIATMTHKPMSLTALGTTHTPTHVSYTVRNAAGNGTITIPVPIGANARIHASGEIGVRTPIALTTMHITAAYAIA